MKVSIITATWNSASTIGTCLESVSAQRYPFIEHIIVDGASSDNTLNIISQYSGTNRFVVSERDDGIYDALNKGLSRATGDVIGFLHSDDYFPDPTSIELVVDAFNSNPGVSAVYGDLVYVNQDLPNRVVRHWRSSDFSRPLLRKGWMPPHPTLYIKKDCIKATGNFRTDFRISADYDFILRLFNNSSFQFKYIPQILVCMRTGGASNKSLSNIIKKSLEDVRAMRSIDFDLFTIVQALMFKNFSKIPQFFAQKDQLRI